MELRLLSDVHNEFGVVLPIPQVPGDEDRVLVLAGDIDAAPNFEQNVRWIKGHAAYFKAIIYIHGNHEYYGGDYDVVRDLYKSVNWGPKIHYLDHNSVEIDGIVFWGGTMWTGMEHASPELKFGIRYAMNDYRAITRQHRYERLFTPEDTIKVYQENKPRLFAAVKQAREQGKKCVVITHHSPATQSIAAHFRGSDLNDAYCMYLDMEIEDEGPDLWLHGHTHVSHDYVIGKTRVVCNPRGYAKYEENRVFNPALVITV